MERNSVLTQLAFHVQEKKRLDVKGMPSTFIKTNKGEGLDTIKLDFL
jgi:hypothetical protein